MEEFLGAVLATHENSDWKEAVKIDLKMENRVDFIFILNLVKTLMLDMQG